MLTLRGEGAVEGYPTVPAARREALHGADSPLFSHRRDVAQLLPPLLG
ncbi:MAG: hypothetical protein HC767_00365 [Akkermansiaceae bacterium]|nr:hypothetical protein [Akkermansiaceae bacterium]